MNSSSKHTEIEYLNNVWKSRIKAKNSLWKLDEEKDKPVKGVLNLSRLKKETTKEMEDIAMKNLRNPFRLQKENKTIKERIIRDIGKRFESEELIR